MADEMRLFDPPCQVCKGGGKIFSRRLGQDVACNSCGGSGIEAYNAHAPARHTDPSESKDAAETVHVEKDRMLILRGFARLEYPATYFEAARSAATIEGRLGDHFREESLRRRGSDLKTMGLIQQVGRRDGKATFLITPRGREQI